MNRRVAGRWRDRGPIMKHQSNRDLFTYWEERRDGRASPERADIDPAAIRHLLGDTFVLEVDGSSQHRFRLAGTRLCALFARELKGESFVTLWRQPDQATIHDLVAVVIDEKVGVVASVTCAPADDRVLSLQLELLLLPLGARTREARLLGALAPMAKPYWLGTKAVGPLTLGIFRHLGAGTEADTAPRVEPGTGRIRGGLTIYDGGRAD